MAEGEIFGRDLDNKLGRCQPIKTRQHGSRVASGEFADSGQVKSLAGHRREAKKRSEFVVEAGQTLANGLVDIPRHGQVPRRSPVEAACSPGNAPGGNPAFEHFLDEKRVPPAKPVKKANHIPPDRLGNPDYGLHHQLGVVGFKGTQHQLTGQPVPVQPSQQGPEPVRLAQAVAEQEQGRPILEAPGEGINKVQAPVVAPVEVFQGHEEGPFAGVLPEKPGENLEEPAALSRRLERRAQADTRQDEPKLGDQLDELGCQRPYHLTDFALVPAGKSRPQALHHRGEGQR